VVHGTAGSAGGLGARLQRGARRPGMDGEPEDLVQPVLAVDHAVRVLRAGAGVPGAFRHPRPFPAGHGGLRARLADHRLLHGRAGRVQLRPRHAGRGGGTDPVADPRAGRAEVPGRGREVGAHVPVRGRGPADVREEGHAVRDVVPVSVRRARSGPGQLQEGPRAPAAVEVVVDRVPDEVRAEVRLRQEHDEPCCAQASEQSD